MTESKEGKKKESKQEIILHMSVHWDQIKQDSHFPNQIRKCFDRFEYQQTYLNGVVSKN